MVWQRWDSRMRGREVISETGYYPAELIPNASPKGKPWPDALKPVQQQASAAGR
jgi:hypothetical protein